MIGFFVQILLLTLFFQQYAFDCPNSDEYQGKQTFAIDDRLLPYFDNMTFAFLCKINTNEEIEDFVRFYHYTKEYSNYPQVIKINRTESLSQWIHGAPVRVIIHGYLDSRFFFSVPVIKSAYLDNKNYNVIVVDWSLMSQSLCYRVCVDKVDAIGKYTADLIQFLRQSVANVKLSDIQIIGHSLGAHIAGAAGKYMGSDKIPVIYGLDPAGPLFRNVSSEFRIDPSDADYVEIIHTDAQDGYGINIPVGHVDFFIDGANNQPSCIGNPMRAKLPPMWTIYVDDWVNQLLNVCSHMRAYDIFSEALQIKYTNTGKDTEETSGLWGTKCKCVQEAFDKKCGIDSNISIQRKIAAEPESSDHGIYQVITT